MNNFVYYAPTRMVFGKDTENQAGSLIKTHGFSKVLIHFGGGSIKKSGLLNRVIKSLEKEKIEYIEFGGAKPNPELALVHEGIILCKKEKVDFILAIGGGSAIDSAKLIAVGASCEEDPWLFALKEKTPCKAIPLGVILTLAASGSEMSASAVITNENGALKRGYNSDFHRPLFSICNPELTYSLPPFQTACGVADIFMHTFERYFSPGENSMVTDRIAEGIMKSVLEAGKKVMVNPQDYEARSEIMWAGSLSHNDITGCGRTIFMPVHQMEHEISGMYPEVAHAAGLTAILIAWMRYVYTSDSMRFAQFAVTVMNIPMNFEHPADTALEGIRALETYFSDINLPVTLSQLPIPDTTKFSEMAHKCTFFGSRKLTGKYVLDEQDILNIFNDSWNQA